MSNITDAARWRAEAAAALARARTIEWQSDAVLRQQTKDILALPVIDRLRMIEENAEFFDGVIPASDS